MKPRLLSATVQAAVILVFLLAWQLLRTFNIVKSLFLSPPSAVFSPSSLAQIPSYFHYFQTTIYESIIAIILAAIIGVGGGFLLAQSDYVYKVMEPYIVWGYSMPKITLFPVFIRLFGLSITTPIAYGSITGIFVILLNTITAVHEVDRHLLTVSESLGMSRIQRYSKIILPSIVPPVFSGLRQAIVQVVLGVLVAELALYTIGVGYVIDNLTYSFKETQLYLVVSIVAVAMMIVNLSLLRIESRFNFWRRQ